MIDLGQIEGGLVQGIGWMTMEEVMYDKEGRLRSNALSTYKVPDIYSVPKEIVIQFLYTQKNNLAIFRSKAVGEPPLMYGMGAFFALRNAIRSFNPNLKPAFDAPMTPEKMLMNLYPGKEASLKNQTVEETIEPLKLNAVKSPSAIKGLFFMHKQLSTWQLIQESLQQNIAVMLLYVFESKGTSPGRQRFMMAVNANGEMNGSLGGGIMEHKFTELAKSKLKQSAGEIFIHHQLHDKQAVKTRVV